MYWELIIKLIFVNSHYIKLTGLDNLYLYFYFLILLFFYITMIFYLLYIYLYPLHNTLKNLINIIYIYIYGLCQCLLFLFLNHLLPPQLINL